MFAPLYPRMPDVVRSVFLSTNLEKIACENVNDPELCKVALEAKILVDAEVFGHARTFAQNLEKNADAATSAALKAVLPDATTGALRGLGYGVGIGAPIAGAGAYIAHRGRVESEAATQNLKKQVLMTALGLSGIGLGTYGLKRLMDKSSSAQDMTKRAGVEKAESQELIEKLSAIGALEDVFDQIDLTKLSEEAQVEYLQTRALNRGYGVRLLYEALQA